MALRTVAAGLIVNIFMPTTLWNSLGLSFDFAYASSMQCLGETPYPHPTTRDGSILVFAGLTSYDYCNDVHPGGSCYNGHASYMRLGGHWPLIGLEQDLCGHALLENLLIAFELRVPRHK